jgi:energy-coupling factor transporter ATP-binding protein EcfA2
VGTLGDFEAAFALVDNPFSPQAFRGIDPYLLGDLPAEALRLDEEPALEPLFVTGAGPFGSALKKFDWFLEDGRYKETGIQVVPKSKVFRIIGPEGSGKSTLTNLLVRRLKDCGHEQVAPLRAVVEDGDLDRTIALIRAHAGEKGDGILCVIIDNVRFREEHRLHLLQQELRRNTERPVLMFENCHDAQDVGVPPPRPTAAIEVQNLQTQWLSAPHAVEFLKARIAVFRTPGSAFSGELETFPFDAEEVARLFGEDDGAGRDGNGAEGPMTLRSFSQVLGSGLDRERRKREGDPIVGLSSEELMARRIDIRAAYANYMNDLTGAFT